MTLQTSGSDRAGDDGEIGALGPWFHNLHLPDGRRTAPGHPLGDFPAFKWEQLGSSVGSDLAGVRALDIGCNAGFYSFALAARGAQVVGVDADEHYLRQARWAARTLDPEGRVEFRRLDVYGLAGLAQSFDLVLFLGVLYHLRHPQLALDLVADRIAADGRLFVQTLTLPAADVMAVPDDLPFAQRERLAAPGWPRAAFVEHALAGDPTNWWVPDAACAEAMIRSAGLRIVSHPAHETWQCVPDGDPVAAQRRREEIASLISSSSSSSSSDSHRK